MIKKSVYLKRCGIETKLIVSEEAMAPAHPENVQAIQKALAKALAWNEGLVSGEIESMRAIAEQEDISSQLVIRKMKLAYLAPDIVEAIFKGDIPHTISLGKLIKSIPFKWEDQRESFGFAA